MEAQKTRVWLNPPHSPGEIEERPEGFVGPNLDPEGLVLEPQELGPGVYTLMANQPPKDNNGIIVGSKAALVVDAGINGAVAHQIQDIVTQKTDQPLSYLINTTYHGDHTFGNYAFPPEVTIISSAQNRQSMGDLEQEKRNRSESLQGGNLAAVEDVSEWRLPDIVFEESLAIDLGDRFVELWHFGLGNGLGDVIVYVPDAKVAWTGNFLPPAGFPTMLLEGGPGPYVESLRKMKATLDVEVVVPGHGPMGGGPESIDSLIEYLGNLEESVRSCFESDADVEATLAANPMPSGRLLPQASPLAAELNPLIEDLHRLNVLATYRSLEKRCETRTSNTEGT
jgi:cyclase